MVGLLTAFGLTAAPHLNQLLTSMFGGMGQGAEEELLRGIIGLAHDGLAAATDDVRDAARFRLDLLSALNALFKGYPPASHLAVAAGSLVKLADTYDFFCANFAGTRIGNTARGLIQATCADIIGINAASPFLHRAVLFCVAWIVALCTVLHYLVLSCVVLHGIMLYYVVFV